MPFCEPCNKWRAPNALLVDGTCPKCGNQVIPAEEIAASAEEAEAAQAANKIPWHFWLMIAAATVYLGWRVIQGIEWLIH